MQQKFYYPSGSEKGTQYIDLYIACRELRALNPSTIYNTFVKVSKKDGVQFIGQIIKKTQVVKNNHNPNFIEPIRSEYIYEKKQPLKFEVFLQDDSTPFGSCEITVTEIASKRQKNIVAELKHNKQEPRGKIIIRGEYVNNFIDEIDLKLSVKNVQDVHTWFWQKPCPYLRFFKLKKEDGQPILIYETKQIYKTTKPEFENIHCTLQQFCSGDRQMNITVQLWDLQENKTGIHLGETNFTIEELVESQNNGRKITKEFVNAKEKKTVGILSFDDIKLEQKFKFQDYLSDDLELNLLIAIDFTSSNKPPQQPESLHYEEKSDYLEAIKSIAHNLIHYKKDKKVSMYGFGCIPKMENIHSDKVSHCFNLNDNPDDPEVTGLDGIEKCYRQALFKLEFNRPTYFSPVIKNAMKIAKKCKDEGSKCYQILLILTDGQITDHEDTFDLIVQSSDLPLSFIIIGIGNENFSYMNELDNNYLERVDSNGQMVKRDSACFVAFNDFTDLLSLSKEVWERLTDQVVDYMNLAKIYPKNTQQSQSLIPDQINLNVSDDGMIKR